MQELKGFKTRLLPFLKWVGGKRRLIGQYKELGLIPDFSRYVEPFLGGGAVFFDLQPKYALLNDLNEELITTYLVVRSQTEELIDLLRWHKANNSSEYFYGVRASVPQNSLEAAARFIYLNKTCHGGIYRVNQKGGFNVPYGNYKNPAICDERAIRDAAIALKDATISNFDYREIFKMGLEGDFFFIDPPYVPISRTSNFTGYTKTGFGFNNHVELRNYCRRLHDKGVKFLLCNSDCKDTRELYSEWDVHAVSVGRALNIDSTKRGKITELAVTNF